MSNSACVAERCNFKKGDSIDGTWKVEAFLGEGTFGQVFQVKSDGTQYALKLLKLWEVMSADRPDLLKRFDREYETGRIKSDYLVHSICKGNVRGNAYIVMEYCAHGDLHSALKNTELDLALVAKQVLLGLRDLHANGKVHRDLKPENVLLRAKDHAVLTDFGISGDQNNRLTQRGWSGIPQQRFGTIAYMPPEQINPKRGNATVLPTTDIFSFGVMMYQLLTGGLPFGRLSDESDVPVYVMNGKNGTWNRDALRSVRNGEKWLPLIEGCLLPNFKERLQTIDDVLELLPRSQKLFDSGIKSLKTDFNHDIRRGVQLKVMQGEELGKTYVLDRYFVPGSQILFIGRDTPSIWNHIALKEDESCYISRQHCTIEKDETDNLWIIRDGQFRLQCEVGLRSRGNVMGICKRCPRETCPNQTRPGMTYAQYRWKNSLNGTYVNSTEVDNNGVILRAGDIISIGDVKLRVEGV